MKAYHENKHPKDPRFLTEFRKSFNKDRLNNVPKYVKKIHNNYIEEKMKIRKLIK